MSRRDEATNGATNTSPDTIAVIGDSWVTGGAGDPPLAGAALAALSLRRLGHEVVLTTATPRDRSGVWLRRTIATAGVQLINVPVSHPTGNGDGGLQVAAAAVRNDLIAALGASTAALVLADRSGIVADGALRRIIGSATRETPLVWSGRGSDPPIEPAVSLLSLAASQLRPRLPVGIEPGATDGDPRLTRWAARHRINQGAKALVVLLDRALLLTTGDGADQTAMLSSSVVAAEDPMRTVLEVRIACLLSRGRDLPTAIREGYASLGPGRQTAGATT